MFKSLVILHIWMLNPPQFSDFTTDQKLLSELSEFLNDPKGPVKQKSTAAAVLTSAESLSLLIKKVKKKEEEETKARRKMSKKEKEKKKKPRSSEKLK